MPTDDPQATATKEDLRLFMEQISKQIDGLYQANERWKDEILAEFHEFRVEIDGKLSSLEHRLLVVIENLRSDVNAMYNDKLSQHEDRIRRLENHAGFVAV